jgi:SNF2 family DNA or RNA helicase
VENNLSELWAILDWTTPGCSAGSAVPQPVGAAVEAARIPAAAERLARLVRPFLLRRRKSDPGIAPELPPKTETDRPSRSPSRAGRSVRGGGPRDPGGDRGRTAWPGAG